MKTAAGKSPFALWISRFGAAALVATALDIEPSDVLALDQGQPINELRGVAPAISACWHPPHTDDEITLRLSFSRSGILIGRPRVTFMKPRGGSGTDKEVELANSILKAIYDCTPLHFTEAFGASVAGRIFTIHFVAPHAPTRNAILQPVHTHFTKA